MRELKQIGPRTYYITGPFHIGAYVLEASDIKDNKAYEGTPVCLIDAGLNAEAACEADKLLNEAGFYVYMIINTHYHADHSGGNFYFKEKYNCVILSTKPNAALISNYDICPAILWGADPVHDVLTDYFYTKSTEAYPIEDYGLPEGLSAVDLSGHCIGMTGICTSDNIMFVGDAVIGEETLRRGSLTYIYDIGEHLLTLDRLEKTKAALYVPYHTDPVTNITELTEKNRAGIMNIIAVIKDICAAPKSFDEIYATIYNRSGLETNLYRYVVEGAIVRGYLSYLYNNGELETVVIDNYVKWHTI